MDVSNVTQLGAGIAFTAIAPRIAGSGKSDASGNILPEIGTVAAHSENPQVTGSASQKSTSSSKPDSTKLHDLVNQANETLQGRFSDLKFTVAEGTDIRVVRIEDTKTGELIRQVPSEAMVAIARALDAAQRGMMVEEKV
jgi:flagellar protein FlaG